MKLDSFLKEKQWKLIIANIAVFILGFILFYLVFSIGESKKDFNINLLVSCIGSILGWVTGVLISPYGADEERQFSNYTKIISAFISGYLVSKIDRIFEDIIKNDLYLQYLFLCRVFLFVSFFFLSILLVYMNRRYALPKKH